MLNVIIIGTGNVSHHICKAIEKTKNLKLTQLLGRKKDLPKNYNQSIYIKDIIKELKRWETIPKCKEPVTKEML